MTTAREKMRAKIAALRAKTQAAGCTEAEALAAAELAARLMREHQLDEADIDLVDAMAAEPATRPTWRTPLAATIAHCTNTAAITLTSCGGAAILFVGRDPGPEIALYLRDVCFRAVARETRVFKATAFYRRRRSLATKRAAVADFIDGLVSRLAHRLLVLFEPLRNDAARELAVAAIDRRFPGNVERRKPERERRFGQATDAGWRAGGDVALNRAMAGGNGAPALIGRR